MKYNIYSLAKAVHSNDFTLKTFLIILLFCFSNNLFAEGSKDLYPDGASGNRAFLISMTCSACPYNPFPTIGRQYVYAKVGERILLGSSVQGVNSGTINAYSPNGDFKTSGTNTTIGKIGNRQSELAGPKLFSSDNTANRFTPYEITVQEGQEGVWVIEFVSRLGMRQTHPNGSGSTTTVIALGAGEDFSSNQTSISNWNTNNSSAFIAAWDVTVVNNNSPISGRVYMNVFNGSIGGGVDNGFYGKFYTLTKDGFVYLVDNNGQNGQSFNTFVNNRGTKYHSTLAGKSFTTSTSSYANALWDPRKFDNGIIDYTHKMFYNKPNSNLPTNAKIWGYKDSSMSETNLTIVPSNGDQRDLWLKPIRRNADVLNGVKFIGVEGTEGYAGKKGGYFVFESHVIGTASIKIPLTPTNILTYTDIPIQAGENKVYWNGVYNGVNYLENLTNDIITSNIELNVSGAEVHFPMLDIEYNKLGIFIELLDETLTNTISDIVYWDLTNATVNKQNGVPTTNLVGLPSKGTISTSESTNKRLYWSGTGQYGNDKGVVVWTNIKASVSLTNGPIIGYRSSDLQVTSMTQTNGPVIPYLNSNMEYSVEISNVGNLANVTEFAPTFMFFAPTGTQINPAEITFISTTGATLNLSEGVVTVFENAGVIAYSIKVNLPENSNGKFTIPVKAPIETTMSKFNVWGTIIRAKDTTDPNATNTDLSITVPSDPFFEANGIHRTMNNLDLNGNIAGNSNFANLLNSINGTIASTNPNFTNNIRLVENNINSSVCIQDGDFTEAGLPTTVGISTHQIKMNGWPENIPNGFIALESRDKGFVISRVTRSSSIANPKPGMLVYDNTDNCVKLYKITNPATNQGDWSCIKRSCNK